MSRQDNGEGEQASTNGLSRLPRSAHQLKHERLNKNEQTNSYLSMIFLAFFSRTPPTSSKPKPACNRKQRNPQMRTNSMLMTLASSGSSSARRVGTASVMVVSFDIAVGKKSKSQCKWALKKIMFCQEIMKSKRNSRLSR